MLDTMCRKMNLPYDAAELAEILAERVPDTGAGSVYWV